MSMDDSQDQDCTVYIQELKSDNPSLKLNAATKISVIGSVLGHSRVKDQLIPYLIEIIEQMDNENDFLVKVCEGILDLKRCCSSPVQISTLIYPLRVLASLDQPPVRDKAVNCLKQLAEGQGKDFYDKYYYPLITTLTKKEANYPAKIAACCLIPSTYSKLAQHKQQELRKTFKALALNENSPLIRRATAQNIEQFASHIDKKIIRGDFYEIWNSLITDTFDIIKIKALECAVIIARAFKKEEVTEKMFKQIRLIDSAKKSWRVRYSLIQCLVAISPYLQKDIIKKEVVEIFQQLLKDQEAEVRAITLIKLPEVTQKLSQQQSWSVFFQYIQKTSKDASKQAAPTVKLALIESIIPYFRTVDKANILDSGIPILGALLKDENHSVRIGIMQRLMELNDVVGSQNTVKFLIPLIQGCLNDKKWRFKLAIAQNIPNFFKALPYDTHKEFLDKILTLYFKDHNYAVRQQCIKSLVASHHFISNELYEQLLEKHLGQLADNPNYIYRVAACSFLKELEGLEKEQMRQLLSLVLKKLENEKVANVLVSLFISYIQIKGNLSPQAKKEFQAFVAKVKEEKQDEDVLYYASRAQE